MTFDTVAASGRFQTAPSERSTVRDLRQPKESQGVAIDYALDLLLRHLRQVMRPRELVEAPQGRQVLLGVLKGQSEAKSSFRVTPHSWASLIPLYICQGR